MTTAPSLFSIAPNNRPEESTADRPARSLVDLLYDGFYMLILLSQQCPEGSGRIFGKHPEISRSV
jgi:type VI secretion system protein ImpK